MITFTTSNTKIILTLLNTILFNLVQVAILQLKNMYYAHMTVCHLCSYNTIGKKWKQLTAYQKLMLTKSFQANPYLQYDEMQQHARSLNLSKERIKRWYLKQRHYDRQKGFLAKGEERSTKKMITDNIIQNTVSMC